MRTRHRRQPRQYHTFTYLAAEKTNSLARRFDVIQNSTNFTLYDVLHFQVQKQILLYTAIKYKKKTNFQI